MLINNLLNRTSYCVKTTLKLTHKLGELHLHN
jgi:hypothetical protein